MQKFLYFIISLTLIVPGSVFAASNTPSVQSKNVKNITHNTATIYGVVSPGTAEDNIYWFEWGVIGADDIESFKTRTHTISLRVGEKLAYENLKGLSPETQYYFRIMAENQSGQVYGDTIYFTTKKLAEKTGSVVIATTRNVINIREESATLYGYVAPHKSRATYWFEYGVDEKTEMKSKTRYMSGEGGEVELKLSNLVPGTVYYYKLVAENERGIVSGDIKSFKTKGTKPVNQSKVGDQNTTVNTKTKDSRVTESSDEMNIFGFLGSSKKSTDSKDSTNNENSDSSKSGLTGSVANANSDVKVTVKASGTGKANETIEYNIYYKYNKKEAAKDAELQIIIPKSITYAGDTTENELVVKNGKNGEKTYVLPIGDIKKGDSRSITIVGIKNSNTKKTDDVVAKLAFNTKSGKMIASSNLASVGSSSKTPLSFPTTYITWFVMLNVIVFAILLVVKAKDSYVLAKARVAETIEKKEEIEKEIKDTLLNEEKREEVKPHFNPEVLHKSPNNNPIPVKPKIADNYRSININEVGLPGMEAI